MKKDKSIRKVISEVNQSLIWYKKGGWIDARRTPSSSVNMVDTLSDYVEARLNREFWNIPELSKACELSEGHVFTLTLDGVDEAKRKFREATATLINPDTIDSPSDELLEALEEVKLWLGGSVLKFNSVKVKIKYEIDG